MVWWFAFAIVVVASVGTLEGVSNMVVYAALHRNLSDDPGQWVSGDESESRARRSRELLAPALIAFAASVAANVGTGLLLEERDQGIAGILGSNGLLWLMGGVFALVIFIGYLILLPSRTSWDLTRTYEALYLYLTDNARPEGADRSKAHQKLLELDRLHNLSGVKGDAGESPVKRNGELRRQIAGGDLMRLPASAVNAKPQWLIGPLKAHPFPRAATWRWIVRSRRATGFLLLTELILAVTVVVWCIRTGSTSWQPALILCLWLGLSVTASVLSLRLEFAWYARTAARSMLARQLVKTVLDEPGPSGDGSTATRDVLLMRVGPLKLTRAKR